MRKNILIAALFFGLAQLGLAMPTMAASCAGVAENLKNQHGGKILKVNKKNQNGATICVIDILVPGTDGNPPRKKRFQVKQ